MKRELSPVLAFHFVMVFRSEVKTNLLSTETAAFSWIPAWKWWGFQMEKEGGKRDGKEGNMMGEEQRRDH